MTQCQDMEANDMDCHRITSLAFDPDGSKKRLYFWPSYERLTSLELSDNSAQPGSGTLSSSSSPYNVATLTAGQVIPGDQIVVSGQPTQTVTSYASGDQTQVNITPGFSGSVSTSTWTYNGYFINPVLDSHPVAANVGYPGGAVQVTSNSGSDAVVWAAVPLCTSVDCSSMAGALLAYDSGINLLWCASSSYYSSLCPAIITFNYSTFARPTIANGYVYLPTAGITVSGSQVSGILVIKGS